MSLENILDSDHDLEFPELNDESYMFSDQSNQRLRSASQSGASDDKSTDLDKYISNLKYTDSALKPKDSSGGSSRRRQFALDPAIVGYGDSFAVAGSENDGIGDGLNDNNIGGGRYGNRFSSDEGEDVSDIGEDYENEAKDTVVMAKLTKGSGKSRRKDKRDMGDQLVPEREKLRPPITGDSIFTQEELSVPKHSLHEFEKLEAALDETESENEGDQMDLIGAYLKGEGQAYVEVVVKISRVNLRIYAANSDQYW